jgi:DNA-binding GntR family transcriptional regulator
MTDDWMRVDKSPAPLRAQVVSKLRMAITEGLFKPGERLVERNLCERLEVSRPSIREAIRQLEAEGLIEVVPNRGPVVRALTSDEAAELFDMCAAMEGLCARYFAERGTAEDIAHLAAQRDALEAAFGSGDRDRIRRAKHLYYEAFVAGCHSEPIQTCVRQLNARLSHLWSTSLRRPGRVAEGMNEMRRIIEAIKARDGDAAFAASHTYVQHASAVGRAALLEDEAQLALEAPAGRRRARG